MDINMCPHNTPSPLTRLLHGEAPSCHRILGRGPVYLDRAGLKDISFTLINLHWEQGTTNRAARPTGLTGTVHSGTALGAVGMSRHDEVVVR